MRRGGLTKGTEVKGGWQLVGELASWCHSKSSESDCFGGFHSTPAPVFGVLEDKAASLAGLRCSFEKSVVMIKNHRILSHLPVSQKNKFRRFGS
jgi:hypothetical protein